MRHSHGSANSTFPSTARASSRRSRWISARASHRSVSTPIPRWTPSRRITSSGSGKDTISAAAGSSGLTSGVGSVRQSGSVERATHRRCEAGARDRRGCGASGGHDLPQHTEQLGAHLLGALEPLVGIRRRRPFEQRVERWEAGVQGYELGWWQRVAVRALVAVELRGQHGERAGDGEEVGGDRRAGLGNLGRLVSDGAVHRAGLVVQAVHATEVDQLDGAARLDDVVRLEVAEHEPELVEVGERGKHFEAEGDGLLDGQRVGPAAVGVARRLSSMPLRLTPSTNSMTM